MAKNKTLLIFSFIVTLLALPSWAKSNCELAAQATPKQSKIYIQCLDAHLNNIEREQNSWIEKRQFELTKVQESSGNTQILPLFKRSIISYEKFIEQSCQWRYLLKMPNPTKAAIAYKQCQITLIEHFIDSLKRPL